MGTQGEGSSSFNSMQVPQGMDLRESSRSSMKRDIEECLDRKGDRVGDEAYWDGSEERKYRSSMPRRYSSTEEWENSERRKGSGDRSDSRKRSGGSCRVASGDENEYDTRKESRSSRESGSKPLAHESFQSQSRSKVNSSRDNEVEKMKDRDSRYTERRESSRDKCHGSRETEKNPKRRWEEPELVLKGEEYNYVDKLDSRSAKALDIKHGSAQERTSDARTEPGDTRKRIVDTSREKAIMFSDVEEKKDGENIRRRGKPETHEEENRLGSITREERPGGPRDGRSISLKEKEREKESYRDDRPAGRDSSWSDRNKDRGISRDNWKRSDYERDCGWDSQRRDHEKNDNDKLHNYPGHRKIGRGEAVKTSSSYGNARRSSEMIEILPNAVAYGVEETAPIFTKKKVQEGQLTEYKSAPSDEQWGSLSDDRARKGDVYGPGDGSNRSGGPILSSGIQPSFVDNQVKENFGRTTQGSRLGRGAGGQFTGRDGQQVGTQMPMMGPPFGSFGLPQGPVQALIPNMPPGLCPPFVPNVFIPQFPGSNTWPGPQGVDMKNMLSFPHGLSPVPPGPLPYMFPPSVVTAPNPAMYFNSQGPTRGFSPSLPSSGVDVTGSMGRGFPDDKALGGRSAPRTSRPPGKAPSRGEQNDYSQHFVDTGKRPQNFIRKLRPETEVEDHPKLRELIRMKDEIVEKSSFEPMYYKCDLREHVLSPEFFGTKFDVILVDPPWEEYVHRAPGVADCMEYWTFEEILNLKIEAIADTPSFIFLWVGDGVGLEQGRQCLKKWGFRRCEDICWVKTNDDENPSEGGSLRHDSGTLFQRTKEHCLMGIKGTVRRSTDGHIIHANIDTDVIVEKEEPPGSTKKPDDMYRIIEHFSLGKRRLELFGGDGNLRNGWVTVGRDLSSSYFNAEAYISNFCDEEGNVWQGGGRIAPPGAPHLVVTNDVIESLRPKSPLRHRIQQQQQVMPIPVLETTRPAAVVNSPQDQPPSVAAVEKWLYV